MQQINGTLNNKEIAENATRYSHRKKCVDIETETTERREKIDVTIESERVVREISVM